MPNPSHHTDADLVDLLKKGSESAFEEIFNRYWAQLYSVAYRVVADEAYCKDILQEIFVGLWERRLDSDIQNLGAYLSRAVKFQTVTYFRNNALKDKHLKRIQQLTPVPTTPYDDTDVAEIQDSIQAMTASLPPRCREIFYLSRIEHLSNAEIASKLNISIRTVETQISNALKHIKPLMKNFLLTLLVDIAARQ